MSAIKTRLDALRADGHERRKLCKMVIGSLIPVARIVVNSIIANIILKRVGFRSRDHEQSPYTLIGTHRICPI